MSLILSVSDWFSKEESVPRKSIPILLLIIYSFGGAGIFYAIEEGGVGVRTYWQSLWFVNTVTTTIGNRSKSLILIT